MVELKEGGRLSSNRFECENVSFRDLECLFSKQVRYSLLLHRWVSGRWEEGGVGGILWVSCQGSGGESLSGNHPNFFSYRDSIRIFDTGFYFCPYNIMSP